MSKRRCFFAVVALTLPLCFCQKQTVKDGPVVRIGSKVIPQSSFEAFRKMRRFYPTRQSGFFPGERSDVTFMLETELLAAKAQPLFGTHKAVAGIDWKWREKYYIATLYLTDVLEKTLGIPERDIRAYYRNHREQYKDTVSKYETVKKEGAVADSTGKIPDTTVARDSVFYRTMEEVRDEIVKKLFLQANPPDTAFVNKIKRDDSTAADDRIADSWVRQLRRNLPEFFAKTLYKKMYGQPLSDTAWDQYYGKGKVIKPDDLRLILSWIPESQRSTYESDTMRLRDLARWLLKWELLSAEAQRKGYARSKDARMVTEWARKVEIATFYIDSVMRPKLSKKVSIDTAMCLYGYYDNEQKVTPTPDSAKFAEAIRDYFINLVALRVDSVIYQWRVQKRVKFLQPDWRDERDKDPKLLAIQADSARDSGDTKKAEELYAILAKEFAFLPDGQRALSEKARLLTEKENYYDAIKHYRTQLINNYDPSKRCNLFFMIGFIYDEYLDKPELAEANYKWLLKNTPDCELADDAEFMCLHLDEPMTSVEELRGEATRQGRKIDYDDEPIEDDSVSVNDTAKGEKPKS